VYAPRITNSFPVIPWLRLGITANSLVKWAHTPHFWVVYPIFIPRGSINPFVDLYDPCSFNPLGVQSCHFSGHGQCGADPRVLGRIHKGYAPAHPEWPHPLLSPYNGQHIFIIIWAQWYSLGLCLPCGSEGQLTLLYWRQCVGVGTFNVHGLWLFLFPGHGGCLSMDTTVYADSADAC